MPILLPFVSSIVSSLSKKGEPEGKCEQCNQARIRQNGKREYNVGAQNQLTGCDRQQQGQNQAQEPRRKKGTENIKRRGSAAARQNKQKDRQA
jgi:hypothetical protein